MEKSLQTSTPYRRSSLRHCFGSRNFLNFCLIVGNVCGSVFIHPFQICEHAGHVSNHAGHLLPHVGELLSSGVTVFVFTGMTFTTRGTTHELEVLFGGIL